MHHLPLIFIFFFFNDTATTEIYTLSLHDALPISKGQLDRDALIRRHVPLVRRIALHMIAKLPPNVELDDLIQVDRKSTRLNSSHLVISYAVFCLKKKKTSKVLQRLYRTDVQRLMH